MAICQPSPQSHLDATPDPGPRGGNPDAGAPVPGLNASEAAYFDAAKNRFSEVDSVFGTVADEPGSGLGPRFNANSCATCHAYPAVGGSSPPLNPLLALARLDGARNTVPSFLTLEGPVREPRLVLRSDGTPDGTVHRIFVITGRVDDPGCALRQPDFKSQLANNNVRFRIPPSLFGLGLVEAVPDTNLRAAFEASAGLRGQLGIAGHFNLSENDNTITRFGWKAQKKSLLLFAGEAYNVEQGVTNELFPNEIANEPSCIFGATPEDATNLTTTISSGSPASDFSSDIVNFAAFVRLSMPPTPQPATSRTLAGEQAFRAVGCQACHTVTQTTGQSTIAPSISNIAFNPYSDFAVHRMGDGLADGIQQGQAAGDEFRTAPLWGLGQRLFFLHDGRTDDLNRAILAHASPGSEANVVVASYGQLSADAVSDLLAFLRSL